MSRFRFMIFLRGAGALLLLWLLIWGLMSLAGVFEVTPERIEAEIRDRPIAEIEDAGERRAQIERLAKMINLLDFKQRREFREGEGVERDFFESLEPEERRYFIDLTMGSAFKQMMKAFNAMSGEERQKFVDRARRDMENNAGDQRRMEELEKEDREIYEKIVQEGLRSYYQEASVETKLDLAPLLEEMQKQMRRVGR